MLNRSISAPIAIGIIFIIAIITGGFIWWQASEVQQPEVQQQGELLSQKITLSSLVKGCAETDEGMTTKGVYEETEQEPRIEVSGNQIKYSRAIIHLCCRKAEIKKEIDGFVVNIYEVWSGIGCKCNCFSEIEANLSNVPTGHYSINIYEEGIKPGDENEPMEQRLIVTQEVDIESETAGWQIYKDENHGFEFKYPEGLGQKYIKEQQWPPIVTVRAFDPNFFCEDLENVKTPIGYGKQEEMLFNGSKYCVLIVSEGTAGSNYVTYNYVVKNEDRYLTFEFALRFSNCGTLGQIKECETEYASFNPINLIDRILSTFRFIE